MLVPQSLRAVDVDAGAEGKQPGAQVDLGSQGPAVQIQLSWELEQQRGSRQLGWTSPISMTGWG